MKKSSWPFIIFITVVMLFLLSFVFLKVHDFLIAYEETTISKFKICAVDNPSGNDDSCGNSFPAEIPALYACGYVNANYLKPGNFISLGIYLDNNKARLPLYANKVGDQFAVGNFCRKIVIPKNTKPDLYSIKIYFYRKIVATAQIELK